MIFSAFKLFPSSGASPLHVSVTSFSVQVSASVGMTVSFGPLVATARSVRISWGDGDHTDYVPVSIGSLDQIDKVYHEYSSAGTYVIMIEDGVSSLSLTPVPEPGTVSEAGVDPRSWLVTELLSLAPHVTEVSFGGFRDLSRMVLPARILYSGRGGVGFGDYAMSGCSSVRSLAPLSGVVKTTGKYCFERCSSLTDLIGIAGFLPVAEGSFRECSSLVSIAGLDNATFFGDRIFERCVSLTSLDGLPLGLLGMGKYAFSECIALCDVSALAQCPVQTIPEGCFYGCAGLTDIDVLADRIWVYGPDSFRESGLTRLFAPDDSPGARAVRQIGDRSFMGTPLRSINLLDSPDTPLTVLGEEAFRGCSYLESVRPFGNNLSYVGAGVFRDCYAEGRDAGDFVVFERGLEDISFVSTWLTDRIPPYAFYGDAFIKSLIGFDAVASWGRNFK